MNLARIILIVVALAFAGVTVFLVRSYLSSREEAISASQKEEQNRIAAIDVLVAERDLPAGTILNPDSFRWQPWPKQAINENYITRKEKGGEDPFKELTGAAVKRVISAGDPITHAKLVKPGEPGFLAGVLAPGMRAISIPINAVVAGAGFILPGNLVDLVLTQDHVQKLPSGVTQRRLVSETIMEKLRVLAIDQSVNDAGTAARLGKTATVEVTPKQAEKITVANRMGQLSLLLRSLTEPEGAAAESAHRRKPYTENIEVSRYLNEEETVRERYMVAARDLKEGTLIQDLDFKWEFLEEGAPTTGLLLRSATPLAPFRGSYLKADIKAGQPITDDLIIMPKEQGFIVAALQPGMRAVSFPISQISGVSGYASPGDHVDIMMTHTETSTSDSTLNPRRFTETIFKNIRLLGLEQRVNSQTGRPQVGGSATVEVTPRQAQQLMLATQMGNLTLAMRSVPAGDMAPDANHLPYATDLSVSDALVHLLVYGTRTDPELVRARQASLGAGADTGMVPHRRIVRPRAETAPSPPSTGGGRAGQAPSEAPPGLTPEIPAEPSKPEGGTGEVSKQESAPLPAPEVRVIRVYRGTGMSTVQVE